MAPIMGVAVREDGRDWDIPRRMLQKPLRDRKASLEEIQHVGEFFVEHDRALAESILDGQSVQFGDLMKICLAWYRRPPRPLRPISMGDSRGAAKTLVVSAPSIDGVW
jgi:hypothetical protein